jgi:hypothetical protein
MQLRILNAQIEKQSVNKSDRERAQLLSHPVMMLIKLVTIDGCAHIVGTEPPLFYRETENCIKTFLKIFLGDAGLVGNP